MNLNIASLDSGLTLTGLTEEQNRYFLSDAPHTKVPEYSLLEEQQNASLTLQLGEPHFDMDLTNHRFHYSFSGDEPSKNILWMAWPVLERLHQEQGRFSVHSSSFAKHGKGVVVVGETHSGKTTTLMSAVLDRGYEGISGEHTVLSGTSIVGGTKHIEFFTGLANIQPRLKGLLGETPIGWGKANRIRRSLSALGETVQSAPIRLIVFPTLTDQAKSEVIHWTERKSIIEFYKKTSETIRALNSFLFDNAVGFPPLDSENLSEMRLETTRAIVKNCSIVVVKGNRHAILDVIDHKLGF